MEGVGFIGLGVELLTDEVNVDVVALDVEDDRAVEFGDVFHQVKRSAFGIRAFEEQRVPSSAIARH